MTTVSLRFYEELNDFLPPSRRKTRFQRKLPYPTSVKDLVESCGVPHTEVDLILVNGASVDFGFRISDGDDISVYPVFESFDISGVTRLQERPLRCLQFVADANLGRLARKMRLLGFDVAFDKEATKDDIIKAMIAHGRVILSIDRRLLMRNEVQRGYCVRSGHANMQTLEVVRRFDLANDINPFTRCLACNDSVKPVDKAVVLEIIERKTRVFYDDFTQCAQCKKVYWEGSHTERLQAFVDWIKDELISK
jgi:uncharacterized protein with PIN domain